MVTQANPGTLINGYGTQEGRNPVDAPARHDVEPAPYSGADNQPDDDPSMSDDVAHEPVELGRGQRNQEPRRYASAGHMCAPCGHRYIHIDRHIVVQSE